MLLVFLLALSGIYHPEWVQWTYPDEKSKLLDFLFTYLMMSIASFLIIRSLLVNYQKERAEVGKVNNELLMVNEVLQSTIKKMERIDQTKNKLFSIISHDIRSVASPITGLSEVMIEVRNQNLDTKQLQTIHHINESSRNLNVLLENLLAWARIQMETSAVEPVTFNLNEVVKNSIEAFKTNLQIKKQKVVYNETDNVLVNADVEMIKSIVRNLISNAIKFSNNGNEISINLSVNQNSKFVELTFNDYGIGMSEDEVNRLLDRNHFFTKQGTNLEKGSGLGFIISQDFAEKNGGSIDILSNQGEGSTFTLKLPLS
ncbi:MAG: sensor histidine kinase [Prolixibacteraceae bacterium]